MALLLENSELWYMHDGCPAHTYKPLSLGKVIGAFEDPLAWPARSPRSQSAGLFLWGHMSPQVYKYGPFLTLDALQNKITESWESITYAQLEHVQAELIDQLGYVFSQRVAILKIFCNVYPPLNHSSCVNCNFSIRGAIAFCCICRSHLYGYTMA